MLFPNHTATAPPSKRSPEDEGGPVNSWQSFTAKVAQECGTLDISNPKNEFCWYRRITSVDGQPLPVTCNPVYPSCVSSFISIASIIYVRKYPPTSTLIAQTTVTSTSTSSTPSSPTAIITMQSSGTTLVTSSSGTSSMQSLQSEHAIPSSSTSNNGHSANGAGNEATSIGFNSSLETRSLTAFPSHSPTAAIKSSGSLNASPPVTATSSLISKSSDHLGAVVGGVIGALVLTALIAVATSFIIRRRRRSNIPPSAEFIHLARGGPGKPAFVAVDDHSDKMAIQDRFIPLVDQGSLEDDERPPDFTPGGYPDPVLEKVLASATLRNHYGQRVERQLL